MLYGIQYLRGIAALMVVLFHFRYLLNSAYPGTNIGTNLLGGGASGVDIFFMISGFIIVFATQNARTNTPKQFLLRRAFRIYPTLFLCMLLGYWTDFSDRSLTDLLMAVVPLHQDYSKSAPTYGFNLLGPAWTLTYELWFYAIFCTAMYISHKHRTTICCLLIIAQIAIVQLAFNGSVSFDASVRINSDENSPAYALLQFASCSIFLEFLYGMLLAEALLSERVKISKNHGLFIFFIGCALFATLYSAQYKSGFGPQGFGIWAISIFTAVVIYQKSNTIPFNSTLNFLGNISYSIYLVHYPLISIMKHYEIPLWRSTSGISSLIFLTTIAIVLATVIHYLCEKPCIELGKKLIQKIQQQKSNYAKETMTV